MIKVYDQHMRYLGKAKPENAAHLGKVKSQGVESDSTGNVAAYIQLRSYGFLTQCLGLIEGAA